MSNCRKIAFDITNDIFEKNAYSNIALNNNLKNSTLDQKDRALVTEIVYGTIKYKYTIDIVLEKFLRGGIKKTDKEVVNLLRNAVYQMMYLDKVPSFAVVNESVEIAKKYINSKAGSVVNGVLRNILRTDLNEINSDNSKDGELAFKYSFPKWLVKIICGQYGNVKGEEILKGLNERPSVTVRVNALKISYDDALEKLRKNGYDVQKGIIAKDAIIIEKGSSIENNLMFNEGYITVQDESAMLTAPVMDLKEGNRAIDMCSAPGGKSTHMAEIMKNKGEIISCDVYDNKLKIINENAKRLGAEIIKTEIRNGEVLYDELINYADAVLADVPCSGLGIIRKKPEIKWNKTKKDLQDLIKIQRNILQNASKYVKKGGNLVYSTCTINKGENEENIRWFLEKNSEFEIEPIDLGSVDNIIKHKEGFVTILPNKYMDGFFICKLRRKS